MRLALRLLVPCIVLLLLGAGSALAEPREDRTIQDAAACRERLEAAGPAPLNTACVVTYTHVQDMLLSMLFNIQMPPRGLDPAEVGFSMPTVPDVWDFNRFSFRFETGPVEYREGMLMSHHTGLSRPLHLHPGLPIDVRMHFTVDQDESGAGDLYTHAGVLPCITVVASLVTQSFGDKAMEVVSEAEATGHLVRPGTQLPDLPCADPERFTIGSDGITRFDLELPSPERALLPTERVFLNVRLYHVDQDGDEVTLHGARLYQGGDHLNHIVFPVQEAIVVEGLAPLWHDQMLYVLANASSPLGQHDVDPFGLSLRILDGHGEEVAKLVPESLRGPMGCHGCEGLPVRAVFGYDLLSVALPDGRYTILFTATNAQGSATATANGTFLLTENGARLILYSKDGATATEHVLYEPEEAPSLSLPLLALLATAFVARRLRQR